MSDLSLGPAWSVLVVGAVALLALVAAGFDGVLAARSAGGPLRAGALGPLHESARLLTRGRRRTLQRDPILHQIGVFGLPMIAVLMLAVVPLGGHPVLDLPVGVVWFNALDVAVWAVVWLAGWAPNSAFPLVGGYRFLALALAYELPLMFALSTPAVAAGSLRITDIVAAQDGVWFVLWMPVAAAVYLLGVMGFAVWGPFAAPDRHRCRRWCPRRDVRGGPAFRAGRSLCPTGRRCGVRGPDVLRRRCRPGVARVVVGIAKTVVIWPLWCGCADGCRRCARTGSWRWAGWCCCPRRCCNCWWWRS